MERWGVHKGNLICLSIGMVYKKVIQTVHQLEWCTQKYSKCFINGNVHKGNLDCSSIEMFYTKYVTLYLVWFKNVSHLFFFFYILFIFFILFLSLFCVCFVLFFSITSQQTKLYLPYYPHNQDSCISFSHSEFG